MAGSVARLRNLKSHFDVTFGHASLVIKCTALTICTFYLLCLIQTVYGVIAVTPGYLIPPNFRIWTLLTAGFAESSVVFVIIDIGALVLCARQLEPLWGAMEFLKFMAIVNVGSCTATAFVYLIVYLSTKHLSIWFTPFSGMSGFIGGMIVAFKQIMPDQKIDAYVVIRVQQVPGLLLGLYTLLAVIQILPSSKPISLLFGVVIGWSYLRFYQPRGKGVRGDMSEGFDFASFFPERVRTPIKIMSNTMFSALVQLGVCKNPVRTYNVGAPSAITISLPGANSVDAERRRKKALRALNERLTQSDKGTKDSTEVESWPAIDDQAEQSNNSDEERKKEMTGPTTETPASLEVKEKLITQ